MSKAPAASFETICNKVSSYYPEAKFDLLHKAYLFAEEAHRGQLRSSGEPYMIHPIEVAQTLADLRLDIPSIITGLLHDTVEDTHATLEQIETQFGKDIAELVDGVTKLSKITFKTSEEKQAENFRKMILAMAKDIRVILVKLADRLNNMRTLEHLQPLRQKAIAQETLDIYAPIANRLGISWIKKELEDLCLRYLHEEFYYKLAQRIAKTKKSEKNTSKTWAKSWMRNLRSTTLKRSSPDAQNTFIRYLRKWNDVRSTSIKFLIRSLFELSSIILPNVTNPLE